MAVDPVIIEASLTTSTTPRLGRTTLTRHRARDDLSRRVARAARRALAAAHHKHGLTIVVLAAGLTAGSIIAGATTLATWTATIGALLYVALIGINAVSPGRARKLYGPLGPPIDLHVMPSQIVDEELRKGYQAVLNSYDDIRRSLEASEEVHDLLLDQFAQCGDLVVFAGEVARTGNTLQQYLDTHNPLQLARGVKELRERACEATDARAKSVYEQTADARKRQLETCGQVEGFRDRIRARLALILATLESVQVLVVKLRAVVLEEAMFGGKHVSGGLDVLREDLEILEAAMDEALHGTRTDRRPLSPFEAPASSNRR